MKTSFNRKVLDGLPTRDWQATSTYDAILIVPSGKKHDSGYHLMAIVGMRGPQPVEIAAYCDDIGFQIPQASKLIAGPYLSDLYRCDMSWPAGITQLWGARFTVGESLSTTNVTIETNRK